MKRLYLDHASTSWPKATGVIEAMTDFMRDCGASASRGNYAAARRASEVVVQTRGLLAAAIGCENHDSISFQSGCTAALNVVIGGFFPNHVQPGDHVITSAAEHNAVLRPLHAATTKHACQMQIIAPEMGGSVPASAIINAITPRTRLIALTHASNVTGIVQPVADVGHAIAEHNAARAPSERILFLCDAAQTFGYLPIDVTSLGVHALATPAHKGCGGPVGIGLLYLHPDWHRVIEPVMHGGSGYDGLADEMPAAMPARLEPGTLNVPAIAGWKAALCQPPLNPFPLKQLSDCLHNGLASIEGVRVVGGRGELPIASLVFDSQLSSAEAAAILDSEFRIEVRSGYHCAARLHAHLGTERSGTLRVSCGHNTTIDDVNRFLAAITEITADLGG